MSELPDGWEWSTVGAVASVEGGVTPKGLPGLASGDVPFFKVGDMHLSDGEFMRRSRTMVEGTALATARAKLWPAGTIVFPKNGGAVATNKKRRLGVEGACDLNMMGVVPSRLIDPSYLAVWFQTVDLGELSSGSVVPKINRTDVAEIPLPLPPHSEQRRIVAAIEEHFSRLDAAEAQARRVGRAQPWLHRSVIDQTIGALGPGTARVGDVLQVLSGRTFPSGSYCDDGVPLLRPGNLHASGAVVWSTSATRHLPSEFASQYPTYLLGGRRLLMNLTAQSLADEFLGRVCLTVDEDQFLLNQRIADLSGPDYLPDFLFFVFRSTRFRRFVDSLNTGSLIQHISTKQLVNFTIPVVPLETQKEVVLRLNGIAESAERAASLADAAARRAGPLRRSVLSAAFAGRLAPQDPSDEPASMLLEQIAAERASKPSRMKQAAS